MRIVHFSDWHWSPVRLPKADLYVCTGDMYDDDWSQGKQFNSRHQTKSVRQFLKAGGFQPYLSSPYAPVVCVRGNHDFIHLGKLFEGCNLVHEFLDNEIIEVAGLKVSGHRGVPYINGFFSDEFTRTALQKIVLWMPAADLYLTHYPPLDILDGNDTYHYGLDIMDKLMKETGLHQMHAFGHVHQCGGKFVRKGARTYSNAATTFNVFEGSPGEGWKYAL